jgi:hypothetical protein
MKILLLMTDYLREVRYDQQQVTFMSPIALIKILETSRILRITTGPRYYDFLIAGRSR